MTDPGSQAEQAERDMRRRQLFALLDQNEGDPAAILEELTSLGDADDRHIGSLMNEADAERTVRYTQVTVQYEQLQATVARLPEDEPIRVALEPVIAKLITDVPLSPEDFASMREVLGADAVDEMEGTQAERLRLRGQLDDD